MEATVVSARNVVDLIEKNIGIPWNDRSTRDTIERGDPDPAVKGIATTMMTTFGIAGPRR